MSFYYYYLRFGLSFLLQPSLRVLSVSLFYGLSWFSIWLISPFASALNLPPSPLVYLFVVVLGEHFPLRGVWVLLRGAGESIASFLFVSNSRVFDNLFLVFWDELFHHPSTILWSAYTTVQGGLM